MQAIVKELTLGFKTYDLCSMRSLYWNREIIKIIEETRKMTILKYFQFELELPYLYKCA